MGHIRGHRPKSLTLIWFWRNHRAILQYDWLHAWHSLYDPEILPLYVAWAMFREILKDHASHCHATLANWAWIPDSADRILYAFSHSASSARKPDWQQPADATGRGMDPKPHDPQARHTLNQRLGID